LNKKLSRSISKESKNKKKKIISILKEDFSLENLKNAIIQMRKELNLEFNIYKNKIYLYILLIILFY
jgi:hypothetical protein